MEKVAKFDKVPFSQFFQDWFTIFPHQQEDEIRRIYDRIELPKRATSGSAGYDFFAPGDFTIAPRSSVLIPTGIHCKMKEGTVLLLFPRSGLGFQYRLQMDNTVGVIDSDYFHAKNQGHIFCKLTNDTHEGKAVALHRGDAFVQGVLIPFGISEDDQASGKRTGGLGSTSKGGKE